MADDFERFIIAPGRAEQERRDAAARARVVSYEQIADDRHAAFMRTQPVREPFTIPGLPKPAKKH